MSEIWKIIAKFGFIAMVRQFHDGMQARVQNDGDFTEPFEVTNGAQTGLCYGTNTVQHDVFCHAYGYFSGQ